MSHGTETASRRQQPEIVVLEFTGRESRGVRVFDVDAFVESCRAALGEAQPMLGVKELVERAVDDGASVEAALAVNPGVELLHRSPELTVASVIIPAGLPGSLPHDHRMWAVVGVYGGKEDNRFFRRTEGSLEERGGRSILTGEALAMGDDTVHAICNPSAQSALAAIHVYGGDLVAAERSMWTEPGYDEQPYDDAAVLQGGRIRPVGESTT